MRIGYFLSSEECGPRELVAHAVKTKAADFDGQAAARSRSFFAGYGEHVLPRVRR